MIDAILAMNPGAIIEAVGHTHMVEHFETSSQTGDLRIVTVAKGLSAQDIRAIAGHAANGHIVETYAVEFDGSVDSKR